MPSSSHSAAANNADRTSETASVTIIPGGPVSGTIRPPGSKSLTNRALICAAFASSPSILRGALRSEDTEVMIDSLAQIGIAVDVSDGGRTLNVDPTPKPQPGSDPALASAPTAAKQSDDLIEMYIANSGTTIRFLTAALSAAGGHYRLSGVPRMHLTDAISVVIDGSISTTSPNGCPPVLIQSKGWKGQQLQVAGNVSSQYLSGLMMAGPIAHRAKNSSAEIVISVIGELVSRPYVDMTAKVMKSFGGAVTTADQAGNITVSINPSTYSGTRYDIEPDASAASYFWAAAAITGGTVTVEGLDRKAMQGDVGFVDVLEQMGCDVQCGQNCITVAGKPMQGVDVDMNAISDTVQTLAVVALFASGPTRVRGVAHNRFKETDRIGDLATELRKLGADVKEHEDGMTITPPAYCETGELESFAGATLQTYHDHRMAMSLSLAGLRIPGVKILNPACTTKTYPEYFADLETLIGRAHRWA